MARKVVVVFTKKKKNNKNKHISEKANATNRAGTQPFSEYFNVRTRIISCICCAMRRRNQEHHTCC